MIRDFNLFPETEKLLTLERKYGYSLNIEDLTGRPGKPKKKKIPDEVSMQTTTDANKSFPQMPPTSMSQDQLTLLQASGGMSSTTHDQTTSQKFTTTGL